MLLTFLNKTGRLLLYTWLFSNATNALAIGKLVIIIDDIGNNKNNQAFLKLPKNVIFSILPFTPYAKSLARAAHQQHREVLLHIPMQAHSHNHLLGKGALTEEMDKQTHQQQLIDSLKVVPYAVGANNHMGSQLTENLTAMQWTMEMLFQQGLFFVDSFTSAKSVAQTAALTAGLPALRRHIFLDNVRTQAAMEKQFRTAIKHSMHSPYTILIAHPYPETLQYLAQRLALSEQDYQLVPLRQLIPLKERVILLLKKVQYYQQNQVYSDTSSVNFPLHNE